MKGLNTEKASRLAELEAIKTFEIEHGLKLPESLIKWFTEKNTISIQETLFKKNGSEFWVSDFYPFNVETELSTALESCSLDISIPSYPIYFTQ